MAPLWVTAGATKCAHCIVFSPHAARISRLVYSAVGCKAYEAFEWCTRNILYIIQLSDCTSIVSLWVAHPLAFTNIIWTSIFPQHMPRASLLHFLMTQHRRGDDSVESEQSLWRVRVLHSEHTFSKRDLNSIEDTARTNLPHILSFDGIAIALCKFLLLARHWRIIKEGILVLSVRVFKELIFLKVFKLYKM